MKIIGLSFCTVDALRILRNVFNVGLFPSEYEAWKGTGIRGKRIPLLVVEDTASFVAATQAETPNLVVLADPEWLKNRGIGALDVSWEGDLPFIKQISCQLLKEALAQSKDHVTSAHDVWVIRGNPDGTCGGCASQAVCPIFKVTTDKQHCEGDLTYVKNLSAGADAYSLGQLLYRALNSARDNIDLPFTPKEIWKQTFLLATGRLKPKMWIENLGRLLKSAGVPKARLTALIEWCENNRDQLTRGEVKGVVSSQDVALARRIPT